MCVGWASNSQTSGCLGSCHMAGLAERRNLFAPPAKLVCQHGSGICCQGSRYRWPLFESTGEALVISVDEKGSIQALERATSYVEAESGKIVRGFKSTYKRHGTLNFFAALEAATGAIHTETTKRETSH